MLDRSAIPLTLVLGATGGLIISQQIEPFFLMGSTIPIGTFSWISVYNKYHEEKNLQKALAIGATEAIMLAGFMFAGYYTTKFCF